MSTTLILASQSPRRQELLQQMGYDFVCAPADLDETVLAAEKPEQYVARLALAKARVIAKQYADDVVVLGSDTSVVFGQHILGKPESFADCLSILKMLSGRTHQVVTAIAAVKGERIDVVVVGTEVDFKNLTEQEIKRYWQTGEPQDKAGAYGIQGIAGQFVKQIRGSYSAVVGLPLYETAQLLSAFGVESSMTQA
ncbi:septum formation inhibitor Maf [Colwellia sp. MB02u-10]|jgi:septum formation protein|uniref:Maf family protein n=1 Tax=Colwellia sp. MB02u-10 TaxID=2759828 RepID=UPI0015F5B132|nr:Maf family protein [Colwellia sp. MB02u-10]MBA6342401.1 septum formation inhibitor Maf [Colwellia sp. MB02u-10]